MPSSFSPVDLQDTSIGPVAVDVTADRVALYVDATGDNPEQWEQSAPPGFASVLLFAVADEFLYDPRVVPFTRTLLHLDQSFSYPAPTVIGATVVVSGTITRVRQRGGSYFVTFTSQAVEGSTVVLESVSTFVLSDEQAPPSDSVAPEPPVRQRGSTTGADRSASRHDLVRYSAATRDFNPLHWDHETAVDAGLPGTVVHGLLMYAWLCQEALRSTDASALVSAKIRFRSALRPAEQARVSTVVENDTVKLELTANDVQLVTGTATVARTTE